MSGRRLPILMNTHAGGILAASGEQQLQIMARNVGLDVDVIPTRSPGELRQKLRQLIAEGAERVAVAGGDGTVAHAVQELAYSQTALGILSQGTFNNFASALRLPHNLPAALSVLREGIVEEVDLGKICGHYFTEAAGVGLFADALALYGQGTNKNFVRGVYTLFRIALAFRAKEIDVIVDGQRLRERWTLCEVANTYRIAQAVPIAPDADVTDGCLDVVLLNDIRRRELPTYLRALRAQMHLCLPKVTVLRAREVRFESRHRRNVHADDEIVGNTPATAIIQPRALKVLVAPPL